MIPFALKCLKFSARAHLRECLCDVFNRITCSVKEPCSVSHESQSKHVFFCFKALKVWRKCSLQKRNQFGGKSTPSLNTHKKPRTETKLIKYFNVLLIVTTQHPFLYLRGGSTPAIGKLFPKKGGYVSSPSHVTSHFRKTPTWARFMSLLAFYAKYIVHFHLHLPTLTALTHVLPTRLRSSSL